MLLLGVTTVSLNKLTSKIYKRPLEVSLVSSQDAPETYLVTSSQLHGLDTNSSRKNGFSCSNH